MVGFYVERIKSGKMNLEEVPALWYEAVKKELEEKHEQ